MLNTFQVSELKIKFLLFFSLENLLKLNLVEFGLTPLCLAFDIIDFLWAFLYPF